MSAIRQLSGKPVTQLPREYSSSCASAGVIAQRGRLIEIRLRDDSGSAHWPRYHLTADAAEFLIEHLPKALEFALGEDDG